MKAEQILIELLDDLKSNVSILNVSIAENEAYNGYADERFYVELDVNKSLIKWIEERIEIKKSVIIKENK